MARKWFNDAVPPRHGNSGEKHPLAIQATKTIHIVMGALPELAFKQAAEAILQLAIAANGHLNDTAPWSRMKQPGQESSVADDLYVVLEAARIVAVLLTPLLPDLSERILNQLSLAPVSDQWDEQLCWGGLRPGTPLPKPSPVMQRLELDEPL